VLPSSVRPSVRPSVSETAEQISTKLARNVHWMVLYQICVFGADLKSNMAVVVSNKKIFKISTNQNTL
jgi:hypothetical protein